MFQHVSATRNSSTHHIHPTPRSTPDVSSLLFDVRPLHRTPHTTYYTHTAAHHTYHVAHRVSLLSSPLRSYSRTNVLSEFGGQHSVHEAGGGAAVDLGHRALGHHAVLGDQVREHLPLPAVHDGRLEKVLREEKRRRRKYTSYVEYTRLIQCTTALATTHAK